MTEFLEINEVFGPTIQGEGHAAGQHCMFIRTFGCNLECSWCDTSKTWAVTPQKAAKTQSGVWHDEMLQRRLMLPDDVVLWLQDRWDVKNEPTLIIISGGEPMMQKARLIPLIRTLFDWGNRIHIETAGTITTLPDLDVMVEQYNVSPKLVHSGNLLSKRYKPAALNSLMRTGKARFKFVVRSVADFVEVDQIVGDLRIPRRHVMIMPEGIDATTNVGIARRVVDAATVRGYGLSFRSHILIWGNKEGV